MSGITLFWEQFFSWMPPALQTLFIGLVVALVIIIAIKIVAFVMDVIPFV